MSESLYTYRLTIVRQAPNPKYEKERDRYYGSGTPPTIDMEALSTVVTQEQFEAIRKAVLETF